MMLKVHFKIKMVNASCRNLRTLQGEVAFDTKSYEWFKRVKLRLHII